MKPYDRILTIDFETRWSKSDYTLSKMTTEEYIRDERFKAFGACFHFLGDETPTEWVSGDRLRSYINAINWEKTAVLAHNAQFDIAILEWMYGARPAFIFDSLSMARALRGVEVGNSLAKLASDLGLPEKGKAIHSTDGLEELTPEIEEELAKYCVHDVYLCEEIFKHLIDGYPSAELRLIDMTLKMYTRPLLELDPIMLASAIEEEKTTREELLQRLGVEEAELASNPKFAALLEKLGVVPPTKKSKTTGKETYALAKNDALFQALLNGEREDVALLCEARLRVKSTSERTRAQRFIDISQRGALPVPLSYYGAKSGRWTAAKGSAINMQNLKRGSFLRKAIMAPQGCQLVVGDLSQIEPRVLAWMSDYGNMLNIFHAGGDPYAAFGAQMFGIPGMTKESHPDLRQSAKSALLGCFGPDTLVLTNRGWLPIVQVQATDTVWDGEDWVCHQGVVPQGEKEVLTALGISATSDHEILTEHGWVEWCAALASPSLLKSALSSASLPASVGSDVRTGLSGKTNTAISRKCAARAGGRASWIAPTSVGGVLLGATHAPRKKQLLRAWLKQGLKRFALTPPIESVYSTGSVQSSSGAQTKKAPHTRTTAAGVSQYIRHGLKTAWSSCATLLASMVGINHRFSLIASTTTGGTFRATFGLLPETSIWRTNARQQPEKSKHSNSKSHPLKQRMQTYDIAYAGPRNRYTILTEAGPLVVHNCGYGLGWASFASQLLTGFLGAPPVMYDKHFAKKLGVDTDYIERFLDWERNVDQLETIPHTCSEKELIIHCVAAKRIIDIYRATAQPVVDFWNMLGDLIHSSLADGKEFRYKCVVFRKGEIELPNGMKLLYPDLRQQKDTEGRSQWVYGPDATKLYAGKVTNNIVQAIARIVMTDGMLRVSRKYPVVGTVHDELLAVVPDEEVSAAKTWVLAQMTMEPKYMRGIPLAADGGAHRRYGLAKN